MDGFSCLRLRRLDGEVVQKLCKGLYHSERNRWRNDGRWLLLGHEFGEYTARRRPCQHSELCSSAKMGPIITLPVLFSTHIAFFLGSIQRGPASTALMVEGGVWRRPGPSFRAFDALEGIGRSSVGIISPGMTNPAGILFLFFHG